MGNVLTLRTPAGGRSSISVNRTAKGVELVFNRTLGDGDVRSETVVALAASHARQTAEAILKILAESEGRGK